MRPIPTIGDPERYIDSAFVDSAFIELKSCDLWDVKMLYPILHMDHAEEKCFVRKEMYERLVKAAGNLPDGYRFRIWDAWRPFALQHELFEKYSVDIIRDFHLEELPEAPNFRLDFYEGAKKHAPWCGACFYIAIESRQGLGITIHLKYFQSNRLPPPISLKIPKLFPRLLLRVFQSGFQKSRGAIGVFYLLFGRFERKILSIAPSKGMI